MIKMNLFIAERADLSLDSSTSLREEALADHCIDSQCPTVHETTCASAQSQPGASGVTVARCDGIAEAWFDMIE